MGYEQFNDLCNEQDDVHTHMHGHVLACVCMALWWHTVHMYVAHIDSLILCAPSAYSWLPPT